LALPEDVCSPRSPLNFVVVKFHMDRKMDAILLGKAVGGARLVRPGSAKNVGRQPDAESTVPLAGKNVNARVFHDWSVNPRRADKAVIPAQAGIQGRVTGFGALDSCFRGNDRGEKGNSLAKCDCPALDGGWLGWG
jgi:hypothetical protein